VNGVTLGGSGNIVVLRPDGGQLNALSFVSNSDYSVRLNPLTQVGTYTILVQPSSNLTGSIRLTLWKDAQPGTLELEALKTVTLAYRNQWARMTFNGTAGENLGLEVKRVTLGGSGNIVIVRPDGGQLNALSFVSSSDYSVRLTSLTQTGTYTVLVQPSSNLTGTIDLTLWKDVEGQVLTPAQPAATTLSYRNQWARLTFAGSIGDNLGMEVNGVTLGGSGNIVVLRPDGGQLNALSFVSSSNYSVRLTQLAQAGTYTVLVQPSSNLTGSIQLTLWKDAQPGTFELETPKTVALAYRNQWARMTFSGTAGENLGLDVSEVTLGGSGNIVIVRPDGGQLNALSFASSSDYSVRLTSLTQTGTYTVLVQPSSNLTGTIDLTLWKDVSGPLSLGVPSRVQLKYRNQHALLSFTGAVGENLSLNVSDVTLPSNSSLSVLAPSASQLTSAVFGASGLTLNLPALPTDGTYSVRIVPPGNATGAATIALSPR
jgi:hypothetical protein